MKLVCIIDDPNPTLYAIQFDENAKDELDSNLDLWNDAEFLWKFFKKNESDLRRYGQFHHKSYSIEDAVDKTLKDAINLENRLLDIAEVNDDHEVLQHLFQQLNDMEADLYSLQKSKAKLNYQSWLRLYAIRIDKDLYVITGGAIKLTKKMEDRKHTQTELEKMNQVYNYLSSKNLINEKEFERLELGVINRYDRY